MNKLNIGIILIIFLFTISTFNYEKFCLECINKNKNPLCSLCNVHIIFKDIKIYDENETLNEIIKYNKSISRFGDGEYELIFGKNISFQEYNQELSKRLLNIINSKEKNLLIGISLLYKRFVLKRFKLSSQRFFKKYIKRYRFELAKILTNKVYYSSTITRFYMDFKSKESIPQYICRLKQIWDNKNVVIIEGEKSRLGVGNNLFDNMKSIQRVLCPIKNAFNRYKDIINIIFNKVSKDKLILLALGPTATVLAYDLYKNGYRSIDIGHIDIEYEWYLRNATKKIPIKNKYVNECVEKNKTFINDDIDINYHKQIIAKIVD